jgi:antitoxin (DNA-binding transcriptional repressor) of toxin-antitoxin stability system
MQESITLADAQAHLAEIIAKLTPGTEVVITQDERPIAKLVREGPAIRLPRKPGSAVGRLVVKKDDDE